MLASFKMETKGELCGVGQGNCNLKKESVGETERNQSFLERLWGKIKRHHADKIISVKPLI